MAFEFDQTGFQKQGDGFTDSGGFGWSNAGGFGPEDDHSSFGDFKTESMNTWGGDSFAADSDPFRSQSSPFQAEEPMGLSRPKMNYERSAKKRRPSRGPIQIPWNYIIPGFLIAAAITLCIVFRDVITDFLAQVLAWAIVILVIYIIIRLVFGGRRRRW